MDLEALANHRGSIFGGQPGKLQPTPQEFHNRLWQSLIEFDSTEGIFIEQKGDDVGNCALPQGLLEQMKTAKKIGLTASFSFRVNQLKKEYAHLTKSALTTGLVKLKSKLDSALFAECQKAIEEGDLDRFVRLILRYYDQTRNYQSYQDAWLEVNGERDNPEELGKKILSLI